MTNGPKYAKLGYRIEQIAASGGDGDEPGWYYGRPDGQGKLAEKVGPFDTHEEALKHLEEEIFADDED